MVLTEAGLYELSVSLGSVVPWFRVVMCHVNHFSVKGHSEAGRSWRVARSKARLDCLFSLFVVVVVLGG